MVKIGVWLINNMDMVMVHTIGFSKEHKGGRNQGYETSSDADAYKSRKMKEIFHIKLLLFF